MFHTERTEVSPRFGLRLSQVMNLAQQGLRSAAFNESYLGFTTMSVSKLITGNRFAVKLLEQCPRLIDYEYLYRNKSPDIVDIMYTHQQYREKQHIICSVDTPIIDTYLPNLNLQGKPLRGLSQNTRAVPFLAKHPELIVWEALSENPEALDILEANPDKISFSHLSRNPNPRAFELLKANPSKIDWSAMSLNTSDWAIQLLMDNPEKIVWYNLSQNRNPLALPLLQSAIDKSESRKINSFFISTNPCAVGILINHTTLIYWPAFCASASTQEQFDFIREHLDKVDWYSMSMNINPRALDFLLEFPDRIVWCCSLGHQNIFETTTEYDYTGIRNARRALHEEFHAWAGHPSKMSTKWKDWDFDGALDEMEEDESDVHNGIL